MTETASDEGQVLDKNPDLKIAEWKFLMGHPTCEAKRKAEAEKLFMDAVKEKHMVPYYKLTCEEFNVKVDEKLIAELGAINDAKIKELEAAIKDAEENLGESEIRDAWMKKADYLCQIGDKDGCASAYRQTFEKAVGIGQKIDILFKLLRVGLFFMDHSLITANLAKAKDLMEQGGDWDRKNRLKAYEGLYSMSIRDFKAAADLYLDCVSTFTSNELISYEQLIFYTVISAILTLERKDLREKVIRGAEIQEQLHGMKELRQYLQCLFDCEYGEFFRQLAWVEQQLKYDRLLAPHYGYYTRQMRILAYRQLLSSYRSLTLEKMAESFDVSPEFVDKELHQLIASGALHCKIDKVRRVVETNQLDNKNWQYQAVIKHGDILLNRIQKLSRVINI